MADQGHEEQGNVSSDVLVRMVIRAQHCGNRDPRSATLSQFTFTRNDRGSVLFVCCYLAGLGMRRGPKGEWTTDWADWTDSRGSDPVPIRPIRPIRGLFTLGARLMTNPAR